MSHHLLHRTTKALALGIGCLTSLAIVLLLLVPHSRALPIGQAIELDGRAGQYINLVVDAKGAVHAAYYADVSGTNQIYYTRDQSGSFGAPVLIGAGQDTFEPQHYVVTPAPDQGVVFNRFIADQDYEIYLPLLLRNH